MDSVSEKILRYISDKEKNQALLLTGDWGSGKTYYIKNMLAEKLEGDKSGNKFKIIYISLYGMNSLTGLQHLLRSKLIEAGCVKQDSISKGKHLVASVSNVFKNINLSAMGVGINIGVSDIINVENLMDYENVVLIFDDLERCTSINLQDVVGFINNFTEHKNVPVIIAADGSKLEYIAEYKDIKEKSIYREVVFKSSLLDIYSELVAELDIESDIRQFLIKQFQLCITQHKGVNLRYIKFFINNWCSLFNEFRNELDSSKEYYFYILGDLYKYLFLRALQYKQGKKRIEWAQSSCYGSIIIDLAAEPPESLYPSSIMGFKFIDDYIYDFSFNKKELRRGLQEIASEYEHKNLTLFILRDYLSFSDKEILCLLGLLLSEINAHKYQQKDIKDILVLLVQIRYTCDIYFDIDMFCQYLSDLINSDEGLLLSHLHEGVILIEQDGQSYYLELVNRLKNVIEEKELAIAKRKLSLKHLFYKEGEQIECIMEAIIECKDQYSQQPSFIIFFGGCISICKMIKNFDNQRLVVLREVLQWFYWYGMGKNAIVNDKVALKIIISYIERQISTKSCDKIRSKNLFYLKNALETAIDS